MACGHRERNSLRRMLPAIPLRVALLGRADSPAGRRLVFGWAIKTAMASRPPAGLCRRPVFFWIVFSWLQTVTFPGWFLVGLYMAFYLAAWAWFCGRLRPTLRKKRREKPIEGLDAVSRRLNEKYAAEHPASLDPAVVASPDRRAGDQTTNAPAGRDGGSSAASDDNAAAARRSPWLSSLSNLRLAFLLAAGWVALEVLRGIVFSGWSWNSLGSALHGQLVMIQIAEFTGVAGISFLVAFTNVILLATVRRFVLETQVKPMRPHFDLTSNASPRLGRFSGSTVV